MIFRLEAALEPVWLTAAAIRLSCGGGGLPRRGQILPGGLSNRPGPKTRALLQRVEGCDGVRALPRAPSCCLHHLPTSSPLEEPRRCCPTCGQQPHNILRGYRDPKDIQQTAGVCDGDPKPKAALGRSHLPGILAGSPTEIPPPGGRRFSSPCGSHEASGDEETVRQPPGKGLGRKCGA